jgi:hypothetical protein
LLTTPMVKGMTISVMTLMTNLINTSMKTSVVLNEDLSDDTFTDLINTPWKTQVLILMTISVMTQLTTLTMRMISMMTPRTIVVELIQIMFRVTETQYKADWTNSSVCTFGSILN